MAKAKANGGRKKHGINVSLKIVMEKLQRSLSLVKKSANVPDDVKEGHFAVVAVDDYELKRFVVPLSFLTHPSFLTLLEQAAEEYGFDRREGALTIPCRPSELETILLDDQWVADPW